MEFLRNLHGQLICPPRRAAHDVGEVMDFRGVVDKGIHDGTPATFPGELVPPPEVQADDGSSA